jgi:predicted ATPase
MTAINVVRVSNYRSLADVSVDLPPVAVLFGPNGSGKSTFLDVLWFFRDCAIRGVELATSARSHGIGILWDGAPDDAHIEIALSTADVTYSLSFGLSSGRIEPFAGESLVRRQDDHPLIDRKLGSDQARLFNSAVNQHVTISLREPEKLSLGLYLDFNQSDQVSAALDRLLHFVRQYHSRSFFLHRLKTQGSDSGYETRLWDRGDNAWSVLRNLHDRKGVDDRYETVTRYMAEAFPGFDGIVLEQTGPNTVYASFLEKQRRREIRASGVSDGHLQLLLLLLALFGEGRQRSAMLLLDEPEISLHPWALTVLARAIQEAASDWSKQVVIVTHSPVLMSQFLPEQIFATDVHDGSTQITKLTSIPNINELLEQYAVGSLFMAQAIGGQVASQES